ncbi:hypothetical protein H9Q74_004955 [Fusarium xylarioides]|nr:hypothetical protein H9Q71_005400 [Fusarium xylarioides]KAG5824971.1 hypothetical protein H9Q74_004955 [Fusarium xylarioides]
MDTTNAQRRDKLKAALDERFQSVVSDRAFNRLRDVVGNREEQPFQAPGPLLELPEDQAGEIRDVLGLMRTNIRMEYKNFEFQHRHVVAMMMACSEALGPTGLLSYARPPEGLFKTLQEVYNFQRYFLQQKASTKDKSDDVQQEDGQTDNLSTARKSRSQPEKDECKRYDENKCIVTGAAHPHVCHIVPFSFNSSEANTTKTKNYIHVIGVMFGRQFQANWREKLADPRPHGRGASDKHWNMLCLSPQLHDWWGRGYFAFEYMGSVSFGEVARIELRFHWMPKTTFNSHGEKPLVVHWIDIQTALRDHHAAQAANPTTSGFPRDHTKHPGVVQAFLPTGEQVATGHIFIIWRPAKFVPNVKAMFDLQFAAIKMLAMTGGAGDSKLLGLDDDDDTVAGASVSGFNASVQSPSIAPSHVDSTDEPDVQLHGLRI